MNWSDETKETGNSADLENAEMEINQTEKKAKKLSKKTKIALIVSCCIVFLIVLSGIVFSFYYGQSVLVPQYKEELESLGLSEEIDLDNIKITDIMRSGIDVKKAFSDPKNLSDEDIGKLIKYLGYDDLDIDAVISNKKDDVTFETAKKAKQNQSAKSGTKTESDSQKGKSTKGSIKENNGLSTNNDSSGNKQSNLASPDYKSIACRKIPDSDWRVIRISVSEIKKVLQLDLPKDWTLKRKDGKTVEIYFKNKKIGVITTDTLDKPLDYFEPKNCNSDIKEISVDWQINWYTDSGNSVLRRCFEIVCDPVNEDFPLSIQVNYEEIDDNGALTLANSALTVPAHKKDAYLNNSKKILILGNSHLITSRIDEFLTDMLKVSNKDYTVETMARGYASASTFAQDKYLCDRISDGEYAYVFQCGLYNYYDKEGIEIIKNACDISATPIIIFPAYNEGFSIIDSAVKSFSNLPCLNWKSEIEKLMKSGVDYYDLCMDDEPQHSKPLAGYVGAYAIYKNLFNELPGNLSNSAPLTNQYIRSKLGGGISIIGTEGNLLQRISSPKIFYGVMYTI